jgi:hypothetical protein
MAYLVTQASVSLSDGTATVVAISRSTEPTTTLQVTFPFEPPSRESLTTNLLIALAQEVLKEAAGGLAYRRT